MNDNNHAIADAVHLEQHPLEDEAHRNRCRQILDDTGALALHRFLRPQAIDAIRQEGVDNQHHAFYTSDKHNIYLKPQDPAFADDHPRNREIISSKGCITTDQIPAKSALHVLYQSARFKDFLCSVLGETALYEYADTLSSINLHYAGEGQQLGWHFDNSSFAITLMIQEPERGGSFEFVSNVRDADQGEMHYDRAARVIDGDVAPQILSIKEGTLVLFRGRNSMHRVTPVQGNRTRMLVVLAYNTKPGISLSESARMTFYGRLD